MSTVSYIKRVESVDGARSCWTPLFTPPNNYKNQYGASSLMDLTQWSHLAKSTLRGDGSCRVGTVSFIRVIVLSLVYMLAL